MIKLTKRLEAIKNHIPFGSSVIDVGTDHGYIPVYLAENELSGSITATDINPGPLSRAKELALQQGVSDKISFVLTDGLNGVTDEADTVIVSGMGGETIIGILKAAPWLHEKGVKLVLQPQSKISELTRFLAEQSYVICSSELIVDRDKYYVLLEVTAGKVDFELAFDDLYVERMLLKSKNPFLRDYLDLLIGRYGRIVNALARTEDKAALEYNCKKLHELIGLRKETERWQL